MKPIEDSGFTVSDAFALFSKYKTLVVLGTLFSAALFMLAADAIPKKFKTHFVLAIYPSYFQNPLVRDIVPDMNDSGEMKSQRESLIRQALTPEFLDVLGEKYGLFQPGHGRTKLMGQLSKGLARLRTYANKWGVTLPEKPPFNRPAAQQALLSRIEVFNLNTTTFHVGFVDSDPATSLMATQDIYAQAVRTLIEMRTRNLVNLRDSIRKRLEAMSFSLASAPDPRASVRPQLVGEELADVRGQIRALSTQYTEDHPLIQELRERERILSRWLNGAGGAAEQRNPLVGGESPDAVRETYNDLMKKMDYINIGLESDKTHPMDYFAVLETPVFPAAPIWPKKPLFLLWGLAGGFFGSLFLAAVLNYFDRAALHAEALADRLGIPCFGGLPVVPWRKALPPSSVPARISAVSPGSEPSPS